MASIRDLDLRRPRIYVYTRTDGSYSATLNKELAEHCGRIVEVRKLYDDEAIEYVKRYGTNFPGAYDTVRRLAELVQKTDGEWNSREIEVFRDAKDIVIGEIIQQPFFRRLRRCWRLLRKKPE